METGREKFDAVGIDLINQPVLAGETTRPRSAETFIWVPENVLDDGQQAQREFSVVGNPVLQASRPTSRRNCWIVEAAV
jgi:hypothetical protein